MRPLTEYEQMCLEIEKKRIAAGLEDTPEYFEKNILLNPYLGLAFKIKTDGNKIQISTDSVEEIFEKIER